VILDFVWFSALLFCFLNDLRVISVYDFEKWLKFVEFERWKVIEKCSKGFILKFSKNRQISESFWDVWCLCSFFYVYIVQLWKVFLNVFESFAGYVYEQRALDHGGNPNEQAAHGFDRSGDRLSRYERVEEQRRDFQDMRPRTNAEFEGMRRRARSLGPERRRPLLATPGTGSPLVEMSGRGRIPLRVGERRPALLPTPAVLPVPPLMSLMLTPVRRVGGGGHRWEMDDGVDEGYWIQGGGEVELTGWFISFLIE
jgi:hypothetical protein